jgi:alkylation response protein AidB-like acyl-CoA dehydrogenase
VRDGGEWVINGWKFFSSNASTSAFLIVMAVTDPDVSPYKGMSMFLVPTDTPGVNIERNIGLGGERLGEGHHALIHYADVRVPADALLGGEGQAFVIAQTRLGGGRIHHAMRTIGMARKALDMMCERALSRTTQGSVLADKQFVQGYIADSYAQLTQFNYPDVLLIANEYQVKVPTPFVPGSEFAGLVAEVAEGIGHLAVGDRVFGTAMVGAFGEEIVATAAAVRCIPDGVDDHVAPPSA